MAAGVQYQRNDHSGAVSGAILISPAADEQLVIHWIMVSDDGGGASVAPHRVYIDEATDIEVFYGYGNHVVVFEGVKPKGVELGGDLLYTGGIASATSRTLVAYSLIKR